MEAGLRDLGSPSEPPFSPSATSLRLCRVESEDLGLSGERERERDGSGDERRGARRAGWGG